MQLDKHMIYLIGTGHVFNLSQALITIFDTKQPDIIGIELDQQRYNALMLRTTNPQQYHQSKKNLPIIYRILAQFQENMAQEYGVNAGDEMLTAITYAQSHQIPIELLDLNAQHLFTTMWKTMPMREKLRLLFSGVSSLFFSKTKVEKELEKIEKEFDTYLAEIGKHFPTIKKTLIDDRNQHMAERLQQLTTKYSTIIACVGDGHIKGLSEILTSQNIPYEIIRLRELRSMNIPETDSSHASFSFKYTSN